MRRSPLLLIGFTTLLLSACNSSTGTPTPPSGNQPSSQTASVPSTAKIIRIEAKSWDFTPNRIRAKKGQKLTFEITNVKGNHGLAVPDLGIDVALPLDKTVTVDIPTDKTGDFKFFCNVPCGPGHKDMVGVIEIR